MFIHSHIYKTKIIYYVVITFTNFTTDYINKAEPTRWCIIPVFGYNLIHNIQIVEGGEMLEHIINYRHASS